MTARQTLVWLNDFTFHITGSWGDSHGKIKGIRAALDKAESIECGAVWAEDEYEWTRERLEELEHDAEQEQRANDEDFEASLTPELKAEIDAHMAFYKR